MSQRGWRRRGGGERSGSGAAHARRDEALLRLLELALLRLQLLAQVDALLLVPPLDRCFFVARIRELRRRLSSSTRVRASIQSRVPGCAFSRATRSLRCFGAAAWARLATPVSGRASQAPAVASNSRLRVIRWALPCLNWKFSRLIRACPRCVFCHKFNQSKNLTRKIMLLHRTESAGLLN